MRYNWFYSGTEEWVWSKKGASFTRIVLRPADASTPEGR